MNIITHLYLYLDQNLTSVGVFDNKNVELVLALFLFDLSISLALLVFYKLFAQFALT